MPKNYGFDPLPIVLGDHWIAGTERSIKGAAILQPDHNWRPFCPAGEEQYNTQFDSEACTCFAWTNAIEIMKRRLFGTTDNYSDRFLATASGVTPTGNDPHKVAETIRLKGLPYEAEYPFTPDLTSWAAFYASIPSYVYTLAVRFVAQFAFAHQYIPVTPDAMKQHLLLSPLPAALYAWEKDANGLYYAPEGVTQNHYIVVVDYVDGQYWWVFDSYDVGDEGNFFKKVRWDMPFVYVKNFTLDPQIANNGAWQQFLSWLLSLIPSSNTTAIAPTVLQDASEAPTPVQVFPKPHVSRIRDWAKAIEKQEGGTPKDLNMRSNNPGNLKFTAYTASLGGKLSNPATDGGKFCKFNTYDEGFQALCQFLTDAANDELKAFHKSRTLIAFTKTYANPPSDKYALAVAGDLGVTAQTDIATLL